MGRVSVEELPPLSRGPASSSRRWGDRSALGDAESQHRIGVAHLAEGSAALAQAAFERAKALAPTSPRHELGAELALAEAEGAVVSRVARLQLLVRRALSADPRDSFAHYAQAVIYEALRQPERARTLLELALRMDPALADARRRLRALGER